jgi:KUP system potassium uptake protein
LGKGIWQVALHYGFMDNPNVPLDLRRHMRRFEAVDLDHVTFFVGHSIFIEGATVMKPRWRKKLFLWLANNIEEEFDYSRMPSELLVQIGAQIEV